MSLSVGLGILTFDQFRTGRADDFEQTWKTTEEEWCGHPRERLVVTNGSSDGTENLVRRLGGVVDDKDNRVWYGNTLLIEHLKHNDLIVLSADDLSYREGWLERLVRFITKAPRAIALTSAYVEPIWEWNKPRQLVAYGGQRALIRDSVCGSSWAFRSEDWFDWMGPFEETMPGEDLLVCQRIRQRNWKMAALDEAEHVGQERSAWGNRSHENAAPLDPAEWGLR